MSSQPTRHVSQKPKPNPNRVSPWILLGVGLGTVILAGIAVLAGVNINEQQLGAFSDVLLFLLGVLGAGGGAVAFSFRATQDVTPVRPGDHPRNQDGEELYPLPRPARKVRGGRDQDDRHPID